MGRKHVCFILFLTLLILPEARSVTCSESGTFQADGTCYEYFTEPATYSNAELACQSNGKVLAKVTKISNEFFEKFINQAEGKSWIGASDTVQEGAWVWAAGGDAGSELSTLWYFNNPTNATNNYDCAAIFKWIKEVFVDGAQSIIDVLNIIDAECSNSYPFLCMEPDAITTPDLVASTSSKNDPDTTEPTTEPTTNTEASKAGASLTSLTTSSIIPLTETNASMTTKPTLMKCGANCIDFNVLLFLTLCVFIYLVI